MNKQWSYQSPMSLKKPHLTPHDLIQKMCDKGITFETDSKEYAEKYLLEKNNFFRLYSYRKNFQKASLGALKGKYLNLDFAHLKALAVLDLQIRKQILSICIDIEHNLKLLILRDFENEKENDGYNIIVSFFEHNSYITKGIIEKSLCHSGYTHELLGKYVIDKQNSSFDSFNFNAFDDCTKAYYIDMPIWVLLETITFGELIKFYEFYYTYYEKKQPIPKNILSCVKSIRNACAHNNCILNNLSDKSTKPISAIRTFSTSIRNISKNSAENNLHRRVLHEYASVIYAAYTCVPPDILHHNLKELQKDLNKFESKYLSLFQKNDLILSSFQFMKKMIDI